MPTGWAANIILRLAGGDEMKNGTVILPPEKKPLTL